MSVIAAEALFRARSQYVRQPEAASARPVQIKALLDALPLPTAIFDTVSRQVHSNRNLNAQLQHDPKSNDVMRILREVARAVALEKTEVSRDVRTVGGRYRVRATYLQMPLIGTGESVVISVEQLDAPVPAANTLRSHFGLTDQEGRVTLLLAERAPTIVIADRLSITKNTVRRHIERVLAKLQVVTRADIRDRIVALNRRT